jgi:hypothetical protein
MLLKKATYRCRVEPVSLHGTLHAEQQLLCVNQLLAAGPACSAAAAAAAVHPPGLSGTTQAPSA